MPPTLTYPGVYIVEASSGVHTITGVATSIAAFFGQSSMGPLDTPVECFSPSDYTRTFGAPVAGTNLAQSVLQFFSNGGSHCFVVRLANGAAAAQVMLASRAAQNVLQLSASSPGLWGLGLSATVDYNTPNPDSSFNLKVSYASGSGTVQNESFSNLTMDPGSARYAPSFITQSSSLITAKPGVVVSAIPAGYSEGRGKPTAAGAWNAAIAALWPATDQASFQISVDDGAWTVINLSKLAFTATPTDVATFKYLTDTINAALGAASGKSVIVDATPGGFMRITSSGAIKSNVQVRSASSNDLAKALMLGVNQGGIEVPRFADLRPVPTGISIDPTGTAEILAAMDDLAAAKGTDITQITINGVAQPIALPAGPIFQGPGGPADLDGVRANLGAIASLINLKYPGFQATLAGYRLLVQNLSPPSPTSVDTVVLKTTGKANTVAGAILANVSSYPFGPSAAGTFFLPVPLAPAASDGTPPTQADYIGSELTRTGFWSLDAVDLFNLMVLPGDGITTEATWQAIRSAAAIYCQSRRAFLILDAPVGWANNGLPKVTNSDVQTFRGAIGGPSLTGNSAVYYPRVQINDAGTLRYMGPSGMIAGLYAATDASRGVWKAPAGTSAALAGVSDLEVILTDRQNGLLNPLGVNCLRRMPAGYLVWGARTVEGYDNSGDSDVKYIPVRRTTLFLEETLYRSTQWVVFEPNADPLWAQIRMSIGAFMMGLFRQGAFAGVKPSEAFFVKCDSETTTQADIDLGIVNIIVGFAPLKPAEFVVITIQQIDQNLI